MGSTASMKCFVGCLLSVVSQVLMMSVISEEKGRIEGTLKEQDHDGDGVQDGHPHHDNDSSSSDSDYEPDPRKKSLRYAAGARVNPNMPGGFQPNARLIR